MEWFKRTKEAEQGDEAARRAAMASGDGKTPISDLEIVHFQVWSSINGLEDSAVTSWMKASQVVVADSVALIKEIQGPDQEAYWEQVAHMAQYCFAVITRATAETLLKVREQKLEASEVELSVLVYHELHSVGVVGTELAKKPELAMQLVQNLVLRMLASRARSGGTDQEWIDSHFPKLVRADAT